MCCSRAITGISSPMDFPSGGGRRSRRCRWHRLIRGSHRICSQARISRIQVPDGGALARIGDLQGGASGGLAYSLFLDRGERVVVQFARRVVRARAPAWRGTTRYTQVIFATRRIANPGTFRDRAFYPPGYDPCFFKLFGSSASSTYRIPGTPAIACSHSFKMIVQKPAILFSWYSTMALSRLLCCSASLKAILLFSLTLNVGPLDTVRRVVEFTVEKQGFILPLQTL